MGCRGPSPKEFFFCSCFLPFPFSMVLGGPSVGLPQWRYWFVFMLGQRSQRFAFLHLLWWWRKPFLIVMPMVWAVFWRRILAGWAWGVPGVFVNLLFARGGFFSAIPHPQCRGFLCGKIFPISTSVFFFGRCGVVNFVCCVPVSRRIFCPCLGRCCLFIYCLCRLYLCFFSVFINLLCFFFFGGGLAFYVSFAPFCKGFLGMWLNWVMGWPLGFANPVEMGGFPARSPPTPEMLCLCFCEDVFHFALLKRVRASVAFLYF